MSRPRFLADHDLNEQLIFGVLRRIPAVEFRQVREMGVADRPNNFLLGYATGQEMQLVSHDVNTMPAAAYARMAGGQPSGHYANRTGRQSKEV